MCIGTGKVLNIPICGYRLIKICGIMAKDKSADWPENMRVFLLDTFLRQDLTRTEIEALNEIMGDVFWILIDTREAKRRVNAHYRNNHQVCECCGKPTTALHHKDRNPLNNGSSNLMAVCNSCHRKIHVKMKPKVTSYNLSPYWNNIFMAKPTLERVYYEP